MPVKMNGIVTPKMMEWLDYFEWSKKEGKTKVFLPNEIFVDLRDCEAISTFRHRAFAYSFYYLISYLYRHVKYGSISPLSKLYSIQLIELLFGDRKPINYITKRKGVLDQLGYTVSENDFPIDVIIEHGSLTGFEMFHEQLKEFKEALKVPRNFICNKPVKAFKRSFESTYNDGTFFEQRLTHSVDFTIFCKCLSLDGYGFEEFFVYSFLKSCDDYINIKKNGVYRHFLCVSLGTGNKVINRLLNSLVTHKLIKLEHTSLVKYKIRKRIKIE